MNRLLKITFLAAFSSSSLLNAQKITVDEYIKTWEDIVVEQMLEHGIPASITMAQGILESGYGNSMLAVEGNNHFGIKCHDWEGESILKDDDRRNECFRKYDNASASFDDHSNFLTTRSRYSFLFDLDKTDYESWAKGLKQAGYATNPKYPDLLIDLIEKHELYKLDEKINSEKQKPGLIKINNDEPAIALNNNLDMSNTKKHEVHINKNRTKYIIVESGDTFYQISKEFGLHLRQLSNWNDFPKTKDVLKKGDIVYLMPKRKKSKNGSTRIALEADQELWEVSQLHGIKLKSLMELNNFNSSDLEMSKGDIVFLK